MAQKQKKNTALADEKDALYESLFGGPKRGKLAEKMRRLTGVFEAFQKHWPWIANTLDDDNAPIVELRIKYTRNDSILAMAKREKGVGLEIVFGGGDSFLEALDSLNESILKDRWREDKPWSPD